MRSVEIPWRVSEETAITISARDEMTLSGAGDLVEMPGVHDGVSADALRGLFRDFPAGVAVITADSRTGPVAMTASSVFSASVAPPLIVFSASALSSSTPALLRAETVVIHLIDTASHDVAVRGATSGIDRFADAGTWSRLATGEPFFLAPSRVVRARVVNRMNAGAATIFVVHALEAWTRERPVDASPLVYHNRTWHRLGDISRID